MNQDNDSGSEEIIAEVAEAPEEVQIELKD